MIREFLERAHHARMVPGRAAMRNAGTEQLLAGGGVRQREAQLARGRSARFRSFWCSAMRNPGSKLRLTMRSPRMSRMRDVARPPISAARTLAGSAPALLANSNPSDTAPIVSATTIWFATLQVWPSPFSPTSVMFLPISSNTGLTWSKVACLPPHMIDSAAFFAPTSPPDTGASRYSQPSSLIFFANSFVSTGEIELMSTTILPLDRPSATPFSPNSAFCTSGVSGTIVMIRSACCATSLAVPQAVPPASVNSFGTSPSVVRYNSWPPLIRWPAIGTPMMPRPMNPIFMWVSFLSVGLLFKRRSTASSQGRHWSCRPACIRR